MLDVCQNQNICKKRDKYYYYYNNTAICMDVRFAMYFESNGSNLTKLFIVIICQTILLIESS